MKRIAESTVFARLSVVAIAGVLMAGCAASRYDNGAYGDGYGAGYGAYGTTGYGAGVPAAGVGAYGAPGAGVGAVPGAPAAGGLDPGY